MELKVAELFAGVGGFRVGLNHIKDFDKATGKAHETGGWNFVWANQYEPATTTQHAYNCYLSHFGNEGTCNQDIAKVDLKDIPEHTLLVGGFPCQDYSVARTLSNEQGIEGKKGVLFWEIKRILQDKKTPFVLLENVDRLLKSPASMRGRDFAIMLKSFDEMEYNVVWRVINAADYSMPQKRKRVFIFAFKRNLKYLKDIENFNLEKDNVFNSIFPCEILETNKIDLNKYKDVFQVSTEYSDGKFDDTGCMTSGEIISAKVAPKKEKAYSLGEIIKEASRAKVTQTYINKDAVDKWEYLKSSKRIEREAKNGHKYIYSEGAMAFPDKLDAPARTMLTSEGTMNRTSHILKDGDGYRILNPVECELIQMFPADWTKDMPNSTRYFVMGNALVTGIISRLEPELKRIIENE